ncbi:MAG: MarR family winged helix-turn-helix transcriptional regulator [Candidatus Limnocylindrales bacterium]|jgi:DNA-binding MarR family transcriptional regulator
MADGIPTRGLDVPRARLSDDALETSRLLVEFLHAAYAIRREDEDDGVSPRGSGNGGGDSATGRTGISNHAVRAAIHVYQHGERTVGQLASGLGISYGWASRVVEELEAARYVIRERDSDDRRIVRVRLNPDVLEDVERAYHWRGRAVEEALDPLSESERGAVRLFLRRVTELLREGAAERR